MAPLDQTNGIWKKKGTGKSRKTPKGRQVDDLALEQVRSLLGDRPRNRDLLIEFLHLIQDAEGQPYRGSRLPRLRKTGKRWCIRGFVDRDQ